MSWLASNSYGTSAETNFDVTTKTLIKLTAPTPLPVYYLVGKAAKDFQTGAFTTDIVTTEPWTYTVDTIDNSVITAFASPSDASGIRFQVFTDDESKSKTYIIKIKAELATKEFVEMEYTVYVQKITVPYAPAARAIEKIYHVNE